MGLRGVKDGSMVDIRWSKCKVKSRIMTTRTIVVLRSTRNRS